MHTTIFSFLCTIFLPLHSYSLLYVGWAHEMPTKYAAVCIKWQIVKKVKRFEHLAKHRVSVLEAQSGSCVKAELKRSVRLQSLPSGKIFMMQFWNIAGIPDFNQDVGHCIFLPMHFWFWGNSSKIFLAFAVGSFSKWWILLLAGASLALMPLDKSAVPQNLRTLLGNTCSTQNKRCEWFLHVEFHEYTLIGKQVRASWFVLQREFFFFVLFQHKLSYHFALFLTVSSASPLNFSGWKNTCENRKRPWISVNLWLPVDPSCSELTSGRLWTQTQETRCIKPKSAVIEPSKY